MYLQSVCITSCMDRQRTPRRMNETLDYQKGEPDWFPSPARGNITYTTPVPEAVCNVRGHPLRPLSRLRRIQSKHVTPPGQSQLRQDRPNPRPQQTARMLSRLPSVYINVHTILLNCETAPKHCCLPRTQ